MELKDQRTEMLREKERTNCWLGKVLIILNIPQ